MSEPKTFQDGPSNFSNVNKKQQDDRPIELPIKKFNRNRNVVVESPRDPRFDPRCSGSNDFRHFVRNYSFIDDIRNTEISQLQHALRKEKDPDKRVKIKSTITKMKNKMVETKNKSKRLDTISEMGGKFKVKKSQVKKKLLVDKYKELKDSGKLSKYLERKRKKLINRDGKGFS